jgi:hypothetical protein
MFRFSVLSLAVVSSFPDRSDLAFPARASISRPGHSSVLVPAVGPGVPPVPPFGFCDAAIGFLFAHLICSSMSFLILSLAWFLFARRLDSVPLLG